jgi:hypothetical protein
MSPERPETCAVGTKRQWYGCLRVTRELPLKIGCRPITHTASLDLNRVAAPKPLRSMHRLLTRGEIIATCVGLQTRGQPHKKKHGSIVHARGWFASGCVLTRTKGTFGTKLAPGGMQEGCQVHRFERLQCVLVRVWNNGDYCKTYRSIPLATRRAAKDRLKVGILSVIV